MIYMLATHLYAPGQISRTFYLHCAVIPLYAFYYQKLRTLFVGAGNYCGKNKFTWKTLSDLHPRNLENNYIIK